MTEPILEISGLTVDYGSSRAVAEASLVVPAGAMTTLIGSNGAGKTTILRAIAGLVRAKAGTIRFAGEGILGLEPDAIVARGIALVPEGRRLFGSLSVRENLEIGAYLRRDTAAVARDRDRVLEHFPALAERLNARASDLSGGQQQMLAIGRALMAAPRLLMLDEPTVGLAPVVVGTIARILRAISAEGIDVLLVEQNAQLALQLARHAVILENGRVTVSGDADDLARSDMVKSAYLGI
jgi:branched-chain amino acid transport system ATP-binding protein